MSESGITVSPCVLEAVEGLDPDQKKAVLSDKPYLLVAAGPGSGKTQVLACRFARLIKEGIAPFEILAVTFTNRAAGEMKRRTAALASIDEADINAGTFHSFCLGFLKKEKPGFVLLGRDDQKRILRELGVKNPEKTAGDISAIKNTGANGAVPEVFALYQARLRELSALDLDDLIVESVRALEGEATAGCSPAYRHILIDEYQDINPLQARLLKLLGGSRSSIFAIGDPDQAIYGFRGASHKIFMDFEKDYPGADIIRITRNYRSVSCIVEASDALIEKNLERMKKETSAQRAGGEIQIVECDDEKDEAEFIIKEIEYMMGGLSSLTAGSIPCGSLRISDFAVLSRTNRQIHALGEAFGRSSIPFHIAGPPPALGDLLSRLNSKETADIPPDLSLADLIIEEGRALDMECVSLKALVEAAGRYGKGPAKLTLKPFIEEVLLSEPEDDLDIKADKVGIMTLHASKGLEFGVVFITGAEDGLIPFRRKGEAADIEEERRLFYVGMTRAKERLYILKARKRQVWSNASQPEESPFIGEIPGHLVKKIRTEKKKVKRRPVQKGLFE